LASEIDITETIFSPTFLEKEFTIITGFARSEIDFPALRTEARHTHDIHITATEFLYITESLHDISLGVDASVAISTS
jgi:hypothetical protein